MKHALLTLAFLVLSAPAFSAQPTVASIQELMQVMDTQKNIDLALGQMEAAMAGGMQQAMKGQEITADVQEIVNNFRAKLIALMKEEMSWPVMQPLFVELYRTTFTQREIDGMLTFYKSEAGRAVTAKMPLVMQNSMAMMQQRMLSMGPKVRQIQEEMLAEIKAASCKEKCSEAK